MAEKLNLKNIKCPTCGAPLKMPENSKEPIICVYCENTIVAVAETAVSEPKETPSAGLGGVVRIEGMKTSSSVLAYMEQFFEEYDWEAFSYSETISITEINKLVNSCKASSADDKNTWIACFKAASVPFIHKVEGCNQVLLSVIEEYKKENLDAYSMFDAYKRIAAMIADSKSDVIANLEKFSDKAVKYGASDAENSDMKAEIERIRNIENIETYKNVEDIPEIKKFIDEKNAAIVRELATKGIDAESEYIRAKNLIDEKKYVEALNILFLLKGYSDSNSLIKKIDKYFLISDIVEVEGKLYYYQKNAQSSTDNIYDLYATVNGKVSGTVLITNISKIIISYADILYYLNNKGDLKKYNLSSMTEETIYKGRIKKDTIEVYGGKVYLLADVNATEYSTLEKLNLIELNTATGEVKVVLSEIKQIVSFTDNKIVYTALETTKDKNGIIVSRQINTNIINVDTGDIVNLGSKKILIKGFVENSVVYTSEAPNSANMDLYVKDLASDEPAKLIEKNIFGFFDIIEGRLFYYVGNSKKTYMININSDGSDRKEWLIYISKILFVQGGWLYFIRKRGYNSVLCKTRLDGSKFSIIAADIEEFISIKNGYLYYINDESTLVKVRMDGSNLQKLCDNVETVLSVKEDKIVFVSVDDVVKSTSFVQTTSKSVKSIYSIDFSGEGIIKLVYNIKEAKEYDEDIIYYISEKTNKLTTYGISEKKIDELYKLNIETREIDKLLDTEIEKEKEEPEDSSSKFKTAMIVMGIAYFISFIAIITLSLGLWLLSFLVGTIALGLGVLYKFDSKYDLKGIIEAAKANKKNNNISDVLKEVTDKTTESINKVAKEIKDKYFNK